VVAELTADGSSTREIAEVLGVDHSTVARDAAVANATNLADTVDVSVANAPLDAVAVLAASDKVKAAVETARQDPTVGLFCVLLGGNVATFGRWFFLGVNWVRP
jgi:hypothetical protein